MHNFETQPCGTRCLRWQNKIIKRLGINLRSKVECPVAECTPPKIRSKNVFIFYDNFCNSDLDTFAKVRFKWFGMMLQNLGGFPCEGLSIRVFCFTKRAPGLTWGKWELGALWPLLSRMELTYCWKASTIATLRSDCLKQNWHIFQDSTVIHGLFSWYLESFVVAFFAMLFLESVNDDSSLPGKKRGAVGDRCHFAILRFLLLHLIGSSLVRPIRC